MCGIAGIMFKQPGAQAAVGKALISMLDGCQHRGPDSTGFALYHEAEPGELRLRFFVGNGTEADAAVEKIRAKLADHDARVLSDQRIGTSYGVSVHFDGDVQKFAYDM